MPVTFAAISKTTRMPVTFAAMSKTTKKPNTPAPQALPALPRDLADFHLRWQEFRPFAVAAAEREHLSGAERDVVRWLIQLADRVGRRDLA